ncbi:MAG: S41 family peptidase [Candidatus Marinimicrobia bacterium]|nr:S41 family peptidase [Candidatus Neomarinimicrobiota bacterium]
MKAKKRPVRLALLVSIVIIFAVIISPVGKKIAVAGNNLYMKMNILSDIIGLVNENYAEVPDWDNIFDGVYKSLMDELDPHSVFIDKKELSNIEESFDGKFTGIGIEFDILDNFITVISPIADSPADKAGLRSGDKIIKIDGESAFKIARDEVPKKLRGPKGSRVIVTIKRGDEKAFDVTLIRDEIPLYSVSASFMMDDEIGYIFVNRFSATTYDEVQDAINKLKKEGMKKLLLDLRGNSGGILGEAVKISDIFIEGKETIVSTKGRIPSSNEVYYSGQIETGDRYPVIVMINRGSASASEIVAGALQDLDRGIVVGETSFGKGLVQRQYRLRDGSAIRVTIAKYYTPSGRLIQRPYENGDMVSYYEDFAVENRDSLLAVQDSIKNRPEYKTKKGRTVLGGGGISPDFHIDDEFDITESGRKILTAATRPEFVYSIAYIDKNPDLKNNKDKFFNKFEITDQEFEEFLKIVQEQKIETKEQEVLKDKNFIKLRLKASIAKELWGYDESYKVLRLGDDYLKKVISYFDEAEKILVD